MDDTTGSPGAGAKFSDYNLGALSNGGANATAAGLDVSGNIFNDISQISIYQFTHIIEKIADARAERTVPNNSVFSNPTSCTVQIWLTWKLPMEELWM